MISVMFVDDDKNLQQIYETLFMMHGIKIIAQAYDGLQAVDLYQKMNEKPDVIIMDQRMPRMDGVTATKKIKELAPNAKIIFLSADDKSEEKALESGAQRFLLKPISIEDLLKAIKK